jgi:hypothetical protein
MPVADMRAITVKQPWAQAIALGAKIIENRSPGFPKTYRGPLLIHAGTIWSARGAADRRIRRLFNGDPPPFEGEVIIAVAELVDVHPDHGCCKPWGESEYLDATGRLQRGVVHLVLEDIRRCDPIPATGALGLWRPTREVLGALRHVCPA